MHLYKNININKYNTIQKFWVKKLILQECFKLIKSDSTDI